MEDKILKSALKYHDLGFSIIPIRAGTKKPAVRLWKPYQNKRADIEKIKEWFTDNHKSLAVVLGKISGNLTCRDFDTMSEYEKWNDKNPKLAKQLPTVETGKGRHVYFLSDLEKIEHIENGELRGGGGYCLLPPSIHPEGKAYKWLIPINGNLRRLDLVEAGFIAETTLHTLQTVHTLQTKQLSKREVEELIFKNESFINDCIKKTIPERQGQRNRRVFDFALALKMNPDFTEVDPKRLMKIVKQWHKEALPNIKTKDSLETWNDFLKAWDNIKFLGVDYDQAFKQSLELKPLDYLLEDYSEYEDLIKLEKFCRALDQQTKGQGFVLDCRKAADFIDVHYTTANTRLRLLCNLDILELIAKGQFSENPKERKANKYKYIWNNFEGRGCKFLR